MLMMMIIRFSMQNIWKIYCVFCVQLEQHTRFKFKLTRANEKHILKHQKIEICQRLRFEDLLRLLIDAENSNSQELVSIMAHTAWP